MKRKGMWPDSRSILLRSQSADFGLIFSFFKTKAAIWRWSLTSENLL